MIQTKGFGELNKIINEGNLKSDPLLFRELFIEFQLDDFETRAEMLQAHLIEIKSTSISFNKVLGDVYRGLCVRHPHIIEDIELSTKNGKAFFESPAFIKAVHIGYLLEILTTQCANDNNVAQEIYEHYLKKKLLLGIDVKSTVKSFFQVSRISKSFFGGLKVVSIEPLIKFYLLRRARSSRLGHDEIRTLFKHKKINYIEYRFFLNWGASEGGMSDSLGLKINILEAVVTDFLNGFKDNALSGLALMTNLNRFKKRSEVMTGDVSPELGDSVCSGFGSKKNQIPKTFLDRDWVDAYNSWNIAFVLGNFEEFQYILPKLFIPSVLNARAENYLFVRVISLWLTMNFYLMRISKRREKEVPPIHKISLVQKSGKRNRNIARGL